MRSKSWRRRRRHLVVALLVAEDEHRRQSIQARARLDWDFEVQRLLHEGDFERTYRMSADSFTRLCGILEELDRSAFAWTNRSPVSIENKVQMTLRFLGGGMIADIRRVGGVDRSYSYRVLKDVMRAPELQITFPTTPTERKEAALALSCRAWQACFFTRLLNSR